MKTIPLSIESISRGSRMCTVAFLIGALGAATVSAQSATDTSSSTASSTAGRAGTGGAAGSSGSTKYGSSDTRSASDPTRSIDNTSSLKRKDRRFIMHAVEDSQKEAAISQLAAQRATSSEVRTYAQRLAADHQRLNSELIQLAQRKGVSLDSMGYSGSGAWRSSSSEPSTNAGIATDNGAPRATGAAGTAGTPASTGVPTNAATATSGSQSGNLANTADLTSDRHYRTLAAKSGTEFDREYVDMMIDEHEKDIQMFQKAAKDAQDSDVRTFASNHVADLQSHLDQANGLMKSAAE